MKSPSQGAFRQALSESLSFLKKANLLYFRNHAPSESSEVIQHLRSADSTQEEYNRRIETGAYSAVLTDRSLLSCRLAPNEKTIMSCVFMECPFLLPFGYESTLSLDEFAEPRQNSMYIRYDWSPEMYCEGHHPAGHLHVGYASQWRVAVDFLMLPHQFVYFLVRQAYPHVWREACGPTGWLKHSRARRKPSDLLTQFIRGLDTLEARLT